jgi:CelD/BcsL family acetyltransferase involved in cellulose biosynthesis
VADDDQGPLAAIPLDVRTRRTGPLRLRVLRHERTTDALVADRADPQRLRAELLEAMAVAGEPVDFISFGGLRDGRGFTRLATGSGRGLATEHRWGGHSVITTLKPYDEWLADAGKNLRASLRKARNRFERQGELTVTTAREPGEVAAAFDEFVALEASGWKADKGALANRPVDQAVFRRFLLAAAPTGAAVVRVLRLDGRPAAAQLAASAGDTLDLMKVAYDDELADLSPSNLLMADLVRECCDRDDISSIDLVTNQPWHRRWHAEVHPTYQLRDPNVRRLGGLAVSLADRVAAWRRGTDEPEPTGPDEDPGLG